jgi:hypothetical protein
MKQISMHGTKEGEEKLACVRLQSHFSVFSMKFRPQNLFATELWNGKKHLKIFGDKKNGGIFKSSNSAD